MRRLLCPNVGRIATLSFLLVMATGCSGGKVNISGKVSYKGVPLKGGNITFNSMDKKASPSARIGEDGSYTINDIATGEYVITVETASLRPPGAGMPNMGPPGKQSGVHNYSPPTNSNSGGTGYKPPTIEDPGKRYVAIPEEYSKVEMTKIPPYTVKKSETKDINLD